MKTVARFGGRRASPCFFSSSNSCGQRTVYLENKKGEICKWWKIDDRSLKLFHSSNNLFRHKDVNYNELIQLSSNLTRDEPSTADVSLIYSLGSYVIHEALGQVNTPRQMETSKCGINGGRQRKSTHFAFFSKWNFSLIPRAIAVRRKEFINFYRSRVKASSS